MVKIVQREARNILLARLNPLDFERLAPYLERVGLPVGAVAARNGEPLTHLTFPEGGVCAVLLTLAKGQKLAVGMIGREGLVGVSALHGATCWRHDVLARAVPATGLRIERSRLLDACRESQTLAQLLLRFAGYFMLQVSRATVTNLIEPLERRMARWILLYHDRVDGDDVPMTHEEIGIMLGVRRASATDVLHILEGSGAIKSTRGNIQVRDRSALERIAAETYGDAEADYRRMIGPLGKSGV